MKLRRLRDFLCNKHLFRLFFLLNKNFRKLCSRLQFMIWRRPRNRVVIRRLRKSTSKCRTRKESRLRKSSIYLNGILSTSSSRKPVRIATFNAALFAAADVLPIKQVYPASDAHKEDLGYQLNLREALEFDFQQKGASTCYPRSILKPSPSRSTPNTPDQKRFMKSKSRVSINLPENEISLSRSRLLSSVDYGEESLSDENDRISSIPVRSPLCFPLNPSNYGDENLSGSRTILEVLREVDADILALQDVKADEEKGMRPLSDLAAALGMKYVFAESWAPEYGNAILSRWPIKRWEVQKVLNDEDIRNVIKAAIDVPWMGEVNVYCTQLDYLDEKWRMEQIKAIVQSGEGPHILAGGLNSLDRSDYSLERWTEIMKYFEEIGKPRPKDEVMRFLKGRGYRDAKEYAGDCEPVVIVAKGQNVQGTCKYATRVDYILSSPDLPCSFLPGSYSVVSSKATSDHHVVKVDIIKGMDNSSRENYVRNQQEPKQRVIRIVDPCSSRGLWQMDR